jgi:hypothetical protein
VTNSHVAGLTVGIEVVLYDGRTLPGKLVGRDIQGLDVALVAVALPPGAEVAEVIRLAVMQSDTSCTSKALHLVLLPLSTALLIPVCPLPTSTHTHNTSTTTAAA